MKNERIAKSVGAVVSQRSDYITRVKTALCREGWLEFGGVSKGAQSGTWSGGRYRAFSHEEWAERRSQTDGTSPCHPEPRRLKVSQTHPGGRAYGKHAEARTVKEPNPSLEARTVIIEMESHRAGEEARTVLLPGSTRTVRARKHAQSVDFKTGERSSRRNDQSMQGALPPAPPEDHHDAPIGAREGGAAPPSCTPPSEKPTPKSFLEEKREAKERERMESAARAAALDEAVDLAWKATGVCPESLNASVRGLFQHTVIKNPDATATEHLDLTLELCARLKLQVGEDIMAIIDAAKKRLEAEQRVVLEVAS